MHRDGMAGFSLWAAATSRKQNALQKPSQEKHWQLDLDEMDWWCVKHGICPRQLLVSRIRSKVVFRPGGGATISVRSKQGDVLLTYRWSPKKGLWADGSRTRLLPLGLRSEVRRAATALREQHRRIYSDAQKLRGRVPEGTAEKRR